ncbi:hypothetical protein P43SY_003730 [Pythium insidiosum]|uniref:Ankyrin repeat protein n=1 Tax=Pythium insidiosum TaxID=114742 RepID=A0AAD5LFT6_PYTIN|nr:hypothetical protein P43SY_003730 [Pythium insidiosum]
MLREYWLGQALEAAVAHGHLSLVRRIHALHPEPLRVRSLRLASTRGDLELLEWLLSNRHCDELCAPSIAAAPSDRFLDCCTAPVCRAAQRDGQLHVVRWMYEHALVRQLRNLGDRAAELGDLEMVQWVHAQRAPHAFSAHAMDGAAAGGFLDVVRFLHEHRTEGCTAQAINGALLGRHDAVVEFLRGIGAPEEPTLMLFIRASEQGRVDLLEREAAHLASRNASWLNPALVAAARHGHLPVVQWLVLCRRMACSPFALSPAAANGHLHVLQWVHAHDCGNWTLDVMDQAAERGQLAVVQWLHANRSEGCSSIAMDHAAAYGHLDVVMWLHAHRAEGCTTRAMDFAAAGGHLHVVQWLHAHRREGCTTGAMDGAAANGHLDVVQWLHAHRSEGATTAAMDRAAANGHLEMVRWLHAHRREGCTDEAVTRGSNVVVRWLYAHRRLRCTSAAIDRAAGDGNGAMLAFLQSTLRAEGAAGLSYPTPAFAFERAAFRAANAGHLQIVRWLFEHHPERTHEMEGVVEKVAIRAANAGHLHVLEWLAQHFADQLNAESMRVAMTLERQARIDNWVAMRRLSAETRDALVST